MAQKYKLICFLLLALFIALRAGAEPPRYIFLFIGDGMGYSAITVAEQYARESGIGEELLFDKFPVVGMVRTECADSRITDSSAAGTAIAGGCKTMSGCIGQDTAGVPLYSIAHKAHNHGYKTGIITTNTLNDATPAAFYAHRKSRKEYDAITMDAVNSFVDLFGGGGFSCNGELKERLTGKMDSAGYRHIAGKEMMRQDRADKRKTYLTESDKMGGPALKWRIDRDDDNYLTLADMVGYAITALGSSGDSFFMMVEGGKIDWASHANDIGTLIGEMFDFNDAIRVALDFFDEHPHETLIVVTSDHETGGLSFGNKHMQYDTDIGLISAQKVSGNVLAQHLSQVADKSWESAKEILRHEFGFWETIGITDDEEANLKHYFLNTTLTRESMYDESETNIVNYAKFLISHKSGIGWTTTQHTGVYVPIFSIGVGAENFNRIIDNTDIHNFLLEQINR